MVESVIRQIAPNTLCPRSSKVRCTMFDQMRRFPSRRRQSRAAKPLPFITQTKVQKSEAATCVVCIGHNCNQENINHRLFAIMVDCFVEHNRQCPPANHAQLLYLNPLPSWMPLSTFDWWMESAI
ncbi:hypothetical protein BLOT_014850 [Blomia tropicalis]|nr:hypothetical protein BLOT_014850 [Blomia tropicalis]